jgi:hypothetical protein
MPGDSEIGSPTMASRFYSGQDLMTVLSEILGSLAQDLDTKQAKIVDLLTRILARTNPTRVPTSLRIGGPRLVNRLTGEALMPGPYSATNDHDLELDLIWADDLGPVAPLPGGTTVASDAAAIITGGDVSANDAKVILRVVPGANGPANITIANPGAGGGAPALSTTFVVNVGLPVPTSLDTANPVAVSPGTPAG